MENIAALLRGILEQISPQLAALPDVALVGGAAGAVVLVLVILFALIGAMAGGKKKKAREEEYVEPPRAARPQPAAPQRAPQPAPQRAAQPAPQRAPQPAPQRAAQPAPKPAVDPVQKIQRDAESGVARAKQDTERFVETLVAERDKAITAGATFAAETPMRGFVLLAEALTASDAPALSAARRKIASGDIDGARADLRRHAQEVNGAEGAWRNLGVLESLRDLSGVVTALEQARSVDPKDFVTLVMLRRLYSGTGQESLAYYAADAAKAAANGDRERAIALDELGVACVQMKDMEGAHKAMLESLEIVQRLAERDPKDAERQRDVAVGHYKIATLGGPDARERLVSSIAAFERLGKTSGLAVEDAQAVTQLKAFLADLDKEGAEKK